MCIDKGLWVESVISRMCRLPSAIVELWVLTERGREMLLGPLLQLMHRLEQVEQGPPGRRLLRKNPLQIRPQQLAKHPAAGMHRPLLYELRVAAQRHML